MVRQAYGIELGPLVLLGGGYRNELWRAGDVVVRLERAAAGSVEWEHLLVRFLAQRVDEVEAPLENAAGSTFVAVWEFCKDKRRHDFDRALAREMVAAYDGRAESDRLVELICVRRRREIEDSLRRERAGEPVDVVYRRHNERSLANLCG